MTPTIPTSCQCESPGLCTILQRRMVGRAYQICQGENVSPVLRESYLTKWAVEAGKTKPSTPPSPCINLGEEVEQRECTTCNGKCMIKVFECFIHGLCSVKKQVGVQTCRGCGDYAPLDSKPLA